MQTRYLIISVRLYATLAKDAGVSMMSEPLKVEIPAGTDLAGLYRQMGLPEDEVTTAFVNSTIQPGEYILREGDEVGIFPPVGGGYG